MINIKQIKFPQDYTALLQGASCLWAGTICFPALQGTFYGVFLLLLWGIFRGHLNFSFDYRHSDARWLSDSDDKRNRTEAPISFWKSRKAPFYFLLAYLLWMTATIFWSDDIREYFRQFEKLIPLYLLALIGFMEGVEKHVNVNKVLNAFLWGVVICIGYMVVRMGVDMFVGDTIGRIKTAGIMSLDLLTYVNHRTYIGCTLLMTVPLLMMQAKQKKGLSLWSIFFFVLFINLLCVMSGARVLMILSFWVTTYSVYHLWGRGIHLYVKLTGIFLLLGLSVLLMSKNQRIQSKFNQLKNGVSVEKIESRTYLWTSAWELIQEQSCFGYGMGDAQHELIEQYKKKGFNAAAIKSMNSHNQYMQLMLFGGVLTVLLLVLFLLLIVCRGKSVIGVVFLIVFCTAFAVEAVLDRNIGVLPFVFFVICIYSQREYVTMSSKSGSLFSRLGLINMILFTLFTVSIKMWPMIQANPRTYMKTNYRVVDATKLPINEELPKGIQVAEIINTDKNNALIPSSMWSLVDSYNNNRLDSLSVSFSMWFFVEDDTFISNVGIALIDKDTSLRDYYDLSKCNTWQKLHVQFSGQLSRVKFYNLILLDKEMNEMKGVFCSYPEIVIDKLNIESNE